MRNNGSCCGGSSYIVTVPGRGYRFAQEVRVLPEQEEIAVESHSRAKVVVENRRWPALGIAGAVLALLIAGGALGYRTYRAGQDRKSAKIDVSKPIKPRRSVAVLGFRNLSGRSDVNWLSTAFSEMLRTELAAGGQVRLVSSEEVTFNISWKLAWRCARLKSRRTRRKSACTRRRWKRMLLPWVSD